MTKHISVRNESATEADRNAKLVRDGWTTNTNEKHLTPSDLPHMQSWELITNYLAPNNIVLHWYTRAKFVLRDKSDPLGYQYMYSALRTGAMALSACLRDSATSNRNRNGVDKFNFKKDRPESVRDGYHIVLSSCPLISTTSWCCNSAVVPPIPTPITQSTLTVTPQPDDPRQLPILDMAQR